MAVANMASCGNVRIKVINTGGHSNPIPRDTPKGFAVLLSAIGLKGYFEPDQQIAKDATSFTRGISTISFDSTSQSVFVIFQSGGNDTRYLYRLRCVPYDCTEVCRKIEIVCPLFDEFIMGNLTKVKLLAQCQLLIENYDAEQQISQESIEQSDDATNAQPDVTPEYADNLAALEQCCNEIGREGSEETTFCVLDEVRKYLFSNGFSCLGTSPLIDLVGRIFGLDTIVPESKLSNKIADAIHRGLVEKGFLEVQAEDSIALTPKANNLLLGKPSLDDVLRNARARLEQTGILAEQSDHQKYILKTELAEIVAARLKLEAAEAAKTVELQSAVAESNRLDQLYKDQSAIIRQFDEALVVLTEKF